MTSDFSHLLTVFEPTAHTGGPLLNWWLGPGFAGTGRGVYCLNDGRPNYRHWASAAAGLAMDRVITWNPPRLSEVPAFGQFLLEYAREFDGDIDVVGGLSLTANYASRIYRAGRRHHFRPLGLTMISPATRQSLRPLVRTGASIGAHAGWFIRSPLFRWTFIRPTERPTIERRLGREVLEAMKRSVDDSSRWWADTLADVGRIDGFGEPMDHLGEVFVVNVEPERDDVLRVPRVQAEVRAAYPGCPEIVISGATRHGTLEMDGSLYASVFRAIRHQYLFRWNLI